jgi:hypothetical protein
MNAQNYGYIYNELVIDLTRNRLIKRTRRSLVDGASSKTATAIQQRKEGEMKLRKEIQFYMCIHAYHRIPSPFVMPRFYAAPAAAALSSPELHIQYFADYEPLTERFPYTGDTDTDAAAAMTVIREILDHLRPLHTHSPRIPITEEEYKVALRVEVYDKIVERYSSVNWKNIYPEFERLTHVNGVKVRSFMEYATIIRLRVDALGSPATSLTNRAELPPSGGGLPLGRSLTYIHGDTHLGNILVPKPGTCIVSDTPRYVFIDPRGYFASYDVFGEPHYDYAKLLFGISGYSRFDQMTIERIDVNAVNGAMTNGISGLPEMTNGISGLPEMNITIPFIDEYSSIYKSLETPEWQSSVPELTAELTRLISLSIWLGNNSTFISPEKKLMSLMISRYLCERFL